MNKHTLSIRIPEVVFDTLKLLSESHGLSINTLVILALKDSFTDWSKNAKKDEVFPYIANLTNDLNHKELQNGQKRAR